MALSWFNRWPKKSRPAQRHKLTLEALEDRTVPSFLPAVAFPVGVHPRSVTPYRQRHQQQCVHPCRRRGVRRFRSRAGRPGEHHVGRVGP